MLFSPTDIDGLVLWMDPVQGITKDENDRVSAWQPRNSVEQDTELFDSISEWQVLCGDASSWSAASLSGENVLRHAKSGAGENAIIVWPKKLAYTDIEVTVDIRLSANKIPGIVLRMQGSTGSETAYLFRIYKYYDSTIRISKAVNGSYSTIASVEMSTSTNTWYTMRAKAEGRNLKLKLWERGTTEPEDWLIETTDSSITEGYVGLFEVIGGSTSYTYYDNFTIVEGTYSLFTASGDERPTWSGSAINGNSGITFAAAHEMLFPVRSNLTNYTRFFVLVTDHPTVNSLIYIDSKFAFAWRDNGNEFSFSMSPASGMLPYVRTNWLPPDDFNIAAITRAGVAQANFYLNGGAVITSGVTTRFWSEVVKHSIGNSPHPFIIGDILVYDRVVSTEDREKIEAFLSAKYTAAVEPLFVSQTFRRLTAAATGTGQTARRIALFDATALQTRRMVTAMGGRAGQTSRRVGKLISYSGQAKRGVTALIISRWQTIRHVTAELFASFIAQTGRRVTAAAGKGAQTKRRGNTEVTARGQTSRAITLLFTVAAQGRRQVITVITRTWQTARIITTAAAVLSQTRRTVTALATISAQTTRLLSGIVTSVGQTIRKLTASTGRKAQTMRRTVQMAAGAGQTRRSVLKRIVSRFQSKRHVTLLIQQAWQTVRRLIEQFKISQYYIRELPDNYRLFFLRPDHDLAELVDEYVIKEVKLCGRL